MSSHSTDSDLQKPDIYNKYSPFYESIKQQAITLFDEIRENLSHTIQLGELEPGFSIWSNKLKQFISHYGFHFTKADHLKLIDYYLSILSITDLNYVHVKICFDMLTELLRNARLITRDDLSIDWRIFYDWMQRIRNNRDKIYGLVVLPEFYLVSLFSSVAWNNIGYIDWEPWLPKIFTRILRGFSVPIGKMQMPSLQDNYSVSDLTKWIVSMMGNGSSCLQYLQDLFITIKSFYHPSNTGGFQQDLVKFVSKLAEYFVTRVYLEHTTRPIWYFAPLESYRLTEQNITDFVNCVKEYAFISIFNKDHTEEAANACHYLSILRPELIVPPIVEKHFLSINSMTEPHRFTSIMTCLTHTARQIVHQTSSYSQGQTYVLPLLMSVLPGIDLNDFEKASVTLDFLETMLMLITCVDCSSAVNTRNDLTETEKEVCLSTIQFEDFIIEFLNRIFQMIDLLSTDISDAVTTDTDFDLNDLVIELKLASIMFHIIQNCSNKIFQIIREKLVNFIANACLSSKARGIICSLIQALVKGNPVETLKYLLPKTCESIDKIIQNSGSSILLTDHEGDVELTWYLFLFAELLNARGDTLLIYKKMIMPVFHQCIHIINKDSYLAISNAARNLLKSLSQTYPIDYRLSMENIEEPFVDFLPIRAWGQYVNANKLQVQFHMPNVDEINFACEFVDTFIYSELTLLNENNFQMSNTERLRSLTIIKSIANGCFRMVPRIKSKQVDDLIPSVVPYDSKHQIQFSIYSKEPKFKENLRMRLLSDIGKLLDVLIENHSDDVSSITEALELYSSSSIYYGLHKDDVDCLLDDFTSQEKLLKNKLCGEGQNIRFLMIQRMELRIQELELSNSGVLNDIDKQVILKLFELSINRYSEVRYQAQKELFDILNCYHFSFQLIVDRIVDLLNMSNEVDHYQIKGCLHILLGNDSFFLPTEYSWAMKEKLWPSIVRITHENQISTRNLIEDITDKVNEKFVTEVIIQSTNEISKRAAAALWRTLDTNEMKVCYQTNIQSYNSLMETLSSLLNEDILTWRQQKMAISLLRLLLQKHVPIPSLCIKTFVDFLVHDNIELRECATKAIAALCRLQKPPGIYVEKILNITDDHCHPGDRDDNLWITINDYKPPETQIKWEQTCFLDKSYHGYYCWPKIIKYSMNKRERYTQNNMPEQVTILYDHFVDKNFIIQVIQLMIFDDEEDDVAEFNKTRFFMFKGLFHNFGLAFLDNFMEQLYVLIHEKTTEKHERSNRVAAEIVAGIIAGSKYWTLEMLNELWEKLTPLLTDVCMSLSSETLSYWNMCFMCSMENQDPRRMYRLIHFIHTLIDPKIVSNIYNETARWSLIQTLISFKWRIPSIWCDINEHAKLLLDHPSEDIRKSIAYILSISLSFDVELLDGKSTRQPNVNQFINNICERLHLAIEVYEKTPLMNVLDEGIEIDLEARKALNFMETVVKMHKEFFFWCPQPVKEAIIRLFPYLCEIESIAANDDSFQNNLTMSRLCLAMSYMNAHYLEALIQKLAGVCESPKWHARRAAIEFTQNMIFCNLFNARPYAKQVHEFVLKCLFDEQFEVRTAALKTLSGLYQCGYLKVTDEDMKYFREMSKINYSTKVDGNKVILSKNIVKRHGGVLGLCAIVLASPYDIPMHVPNALMLLCEHSHDPDLIQKSVKECLLEFRRTHHDSWHEHREQFTEDQLVILADVLISHNYYA
ncbi:unnamed protein product [Adineta steineri]|uniref:Proteasome activator complex subunit 4 n=1 Tax=Adineta steineri TaxID=433720 RepID=A0A813QK90_9BILA|nr:unnamed protein product [Adineta steineri]